MSANRTNLLSFSAGLFIALGNAPVWAQCQVSKLRGDDAASGDDFGGSVSISGGFAAVGARRALSGTAGTAYVFERTALGWSQHDQVAPNDGLSGDQFGRSVAIDSDTLVVGAWQHDSPANSAGAAYVFHRLGSDWLQAAKLTASDAALGDSFGISSAVSGSYAVIGATGDDDGGSGAGSAYVFRRDGNTWVQAAKLTASDAAANDQFGLGVSISGDYALVGAYFDDDTFNASGSAYVFHRNDSGTPLDPADDTWPQEAKLHASDPAAGGRFGFSASINGDDALIGADGRRAAYVFRRSGAVWNFVIKLTPGIGGGLAFGSSVGIHGDEAVVGDLGDSTQGTFAGAAYLYTRNGATWTQQAKFFALDAGDSDVFGNTAAIHAGNIVVGASGDDNGGIGSGSAYVFQSFVSADCNHNGVEDLCEIAAGSSPDCNHNGRPDGCDTIATVVLLGADFEAGLPAGWTASGLWHVTDACAVSTPCDPPHWAYFGQDLDCTFETGSRVTGALAAPATSIPANALSATLTYCSVYDGDRGSAPTGFDSAWLAVDGAVTDDVGRTAVPGQWQTRTVDLEASIGNAMDLSWNFDSIDAISNDSLGWQVDRVELAIEVTANDCNTNGVPDECDADCNTNGTPDDCDIAGAVSADCNTNGVPDECDPNFDGDGLIDDCDSDIDNDGVLNGPDVCDFTPPGAANVQSDGSLRGDVDGDCDVDLTDYEILQEDFTGPNP